MLRRDQHCDLPRLQIECALVVLGARRGGADIGAGEMSRKALSSSRSM
jgi:hypothetical protein